MKEGRPLTYTSVVKSSLKSFCSAANFWPSLVALNMQNTDNFTCKNHGKQLLKQRTAHMRIHDATRSTKIMQFYLFQLLIT